MGLHSRDVESADAAARIRTKPLGRRASTFAIAALGAFAITALLNNIPGWHLRHAQPGFEWNAVSDSPFNWDSIKPNQTFEWHECYRNMLCAKLSVPLDYTNKSDSREGAIAVIRLPSKYPIGHPKWKGPILYNPGGPGGSGITFLRSTAALFQSLFGEEFDHISFDPRGVGLTYPNFDIWRAEAEALTWASSVPRSLNSSNGDLVRFSASFKIFGHLAEARDTEIGRLVSTSFTARDMLLITEAFGWPQLQFIGYSYGSVLGLVFATMFPDRVGRIVVDGIVDLDDYFVGAWSNNLRDADKAIDLVSKACSLSPTHCMLYEPSGPLVRARIERILGNLYKDPLVVFDSDASLNTRYGIVDYGSAKLLLLKMLYSPYALFPITANAFAAAEKGDGRPLFNLLYPRGMAGSEWRCKADRDPSDEVPVLLSMEALGGIACGDAPPVRESPHELETFYHELQKMSTLGDTWFPHTLCAGWKMQATESFRGPFGGNTSHPVLVVGNTADPVTPLWSAEKMARGFSSAVVLTQDSIGHASISAVSPCTFHHIIQYLHEGTLPPEGTVCNIVTSIFPPEDDVVAAVTATLSVAEQRLISPLQELVRKVKLPTLAHLPLFG